MSSPLFLSFFRPLFLEALGIPIYNRTFMSLYLKN